MALYVGSVTFDEENDAKPTHLIASLAAITFLIDDAASYLVKYDGRALYILAVCISGLSFITGLYCMMGCFWDPIPKDRRGDEEFTLLKPNSSPEKTPKDEARCLPNWTIK